MRAALLIDRRPRRGGRLLAAGALACVCGAVAAEPLTLLPHWQPGETVDYEVCSGRFRLGEGGTLPLSQACRALRVEVERREPAAEGGGEDYLLSFEFAAAEVQGPHAAGLGERLRALVESAPLHFLVGADGTLRGLTDWQAVRARLGEAVDRLLAERSAAGAPAAALVVLREETDALLENERSFLQLAGEAPRLMLRAHGKTLDAGVAGAYEVERPSPVGGEPVPVRGELRLEAAPADGQVAVSWFGLMDRARALPQVEQRLREAAEQHGLPPPEPGVLAGLQIEEQGRVVLEVASGWPLEASERRGTLQGAEGRLETLTLRRLPGRAD